MCLYGSPHFSDDKEKTIVLYSGKQGIQLTYESTGMESNTKVINYRVH